MNAIQTFNTGETPGSLKEIYNPEGSSLRKGQLVMLEMLKYIDSLCRKHNIEYRIDSGNVLGAVRHGGFIPWDDDVDIVLTRKEYKKLVKVLQAEKNDRYVVQCRKTDPNYFLNYVKLRDTLSHMRSESNTANKLLYDGFQIDIFRLIEGPIDSLIKIDMIATYRIEEPLRRRNKFLWLLFNKFMRTIVYPVFRCLCFLFGDKTRLGYDFGLHFTETFSKQCSYPYKPIPYEGVELMGPNNPIAFCKEMYGPSFMELPNKEKRNHHGVDDYVFVD